MFEGSKTLLGSALLAPFTCATSACTTWNGSSGAAGATGELAGVSAAASGGGSGSASAGATSSAGADATYGGAPGSAGSSSDLLGATPHMGWNSWNKFQGAASETVIKQIADAMISSGMTDAG